MSTVPWPQMRCLEAWQNEFPGKDLPFCQNPAALQASGETEGRPAGVGYSIMTR